VVEAVARQALQLAEQAVANEAAVRAECHDAAMTLLGSAACNAATIIVEEQRRAAAATQEGAVAATEVAAVDAAANAEKTMRYKAYRAAADVAKEDHVEEAAALAMARSLGKEEEEDWLVRKTHCRSATREHDEESSAAMQATASMLREAARQAMEAAAEEVVWAEEEEDKRAHWAAELNAALTRREDERRLETQRREDRRARSQEAAIWAVLATLDEDDVAGEELYIYGRHSVATVYFQFMRALL
jgi:hypothetical protein